MQLAALQEADHADHRRLQAVRDRLTEIQAEAACLTIGDLQVRGSDLIATGFAPGPELGKCLQWLLEQVQDEILPNEKQALLAAAAKFQ